MRRGALGCFAAASAIVSCTLGPVRAESVGGPGGAWPKSWPQELEPLREQAWTWVGGGQMVGPTQYEIPFARREALEANREEFESAWPYTLSVKSKGAPLTLLRSPHAWVHVGPTDAAAGVRIVVEGDWAPGAEIPPGTATRI